MVKKRTGRKKLLICIPQNANEVCFTMPGRPIQEFPFQLVFRFTLGVNYKTFFPGSAHARDNY